MKEYQIPLRRKNEENKQIKQRRQEKSIQPRQTVNFWYGVHFNNYLRAPTKKNCIVIVRNYIVIVKNLKKLKLHCHCQCELYISLQVLYDVLLYKLDCFLTSQKNHIILHMWKITIKFCVFEIADQMLTSHLCILEPWMIGNVKKVDFFLLVRCLYMINKKINGCWEISKLFLLKCSTQYLTSECYALVHKHDCYKFKDRCLISIFL